MTADELIAARTERDKNQLQMAKELGCPVSSYRKWESGVRKVPVWVARFFQDREAIDIRGLGLNEVMQLDRIARERGLTVEQLVGEFIRRGLAEEQKG